LAEAEPCYRFTGADTTVANNLKVRMPWINETAFFAAMAGD
jgi:hypothetical protein